MDRKLTENEAAFLLDLRELMEKHNALLSVENDMVCIDVAYDEDSQESILLPEDITSYGDIDELILKNS
ncbi:hypothetical protein [Bacteroides cellulosilyticus]|jgi:hypothetical protein|uniref:Uncharacterized protein n=1 Tax=Bacteroides cellulosilyticus TaxID=246787 RepID=A0A5M6A238_9BACE|nr:hypothetical protein [Bacteroides cellulosilyticus]KAA5403124.1 hypothetical protein F2Y86_24530 [Bacteroides cellulosilyticus]RYU12162.1 hypothetical protein EAJ01_24555 [Bacteroides cellulosilyticus]DAO56254.1 MAG TPA: hypothetical protein [Caudoviricetes sp.]DAT94791.1 MAG TPA: hypothetical protein [Caudoviricetes sp.]